MSNQYGEGQTQSELEFRILHPYGFTITPTMYELETFIPYRLIKHSRYPGKQWKYTPEYAQDIHIFGRVTEDMIPIIMRELEVIFPNFRNYRL